MQLMGTKSVLMTNLALHSFKKVRAVKTACQWLRFKICGSKFTKVELYFGPWPKLRMIIALVMKVRDDSVSCAVPLHWCFQLCSQEFCCRGEKLERDREGKKGSINKESRREKRWEGWERKEGWGKPYGKGLRRLAKPLRPPPPPLHFPQSLLFPGWGDERLKMRSERERGKEWHQPVTSGGREVRGWTDDSLFLQKRTRVNASGIYRRWRP